MHCSKGSIFQRLCVKKVLVLCSEGSMFRILIGPTICSVKFNSLDLQSFHLAIK